VDRIVIREEISDREVTLSKAAAAAGVEIYTRFQNAGYRGMYNMDYWALKTCVGLCSILWAAMNSPVICFG
jgi:DNA-damage-inducible protein D